MSTPTLSVVIPCYKQAHLLSEAVDSVLALGLGEDIEIVVVNDGSPDKTAAVAAGYGERIVYLEQENRGLAEARNTGIRAATGHHLMFLDADDLADTGLRAAMPLCTGANVVVTGYRMEYVSGRAPTHHYIDPFPFAAVDLYNRNLSVPFSTLVPRELGLRLNGFDRELNPCEDWDFWVRVALTDPPLAECRQIGGSYRIFPDSMASNVNKMWRAAHRLWLKHEAAMLPYQAEVWPLARRREAFFRCTVFDRLAESYAGGHGKTKVWRELAREPSLFRRFLGNRLRHALLRGRRLA